MSSIFINVQSTIQGQAYIGGWLEEKEKSIGQTQKDFKTEEQWKEKEEERKEVREKEEEEERRQQR